MGWEKTFKSGGIILAGRYVTSNAIHQTSKLDEGKWEEYLKWLYDLEYNKVGIPKPDLVIYLNVPVEQSQKLLDGRYSGDENKKDIHEKDIEYLNRCRVAAKFVAKKSGWTVVQCYKDGKMRSKEDISAEILKIVEDTLF
jgi:dTMP kinase